MPIASIDPKDPLKVWECKALPKRGSQEVFETILTIGSTFLNRADQTYHYTGNSIASPHSKASPASDAKARLESSFIVRVFTEKSKLAGTFSIMHNLATLVLCSSS